MTWKNQNSNLGGRNPSPGWHADDEADADDAEFVEGVGLPRWVWEGRRLEGGIWMVM